MSKLIFMNKEALAAFMMNACPAKNRQLFMTDKVIQINGLGRGGKVTHRMFAFPSGELFNVPAGMTVCPKCEGSGDKIPKNDISARSGAVCLACGGGKLVPIKKVKKK